MFAPQVVVGAEDRNYSIGYAERLGTITAEQVIGNRLDTGEGFGIGIGTFDGPPPAPEFLDGPVEVIEEVDEN